MRLYLTRMTARNQVAIGLPSTWGSTDVVIISTVMDYPQYPQSTLIEFDEIALATSGASRSCRASTLLYAGSFALISCFICLMGILYIGFVRFFQMIPAITTD